MTAPSPNQIRLLPPPDHPDASRWGLWPARGVAALSFSVPVAWMMHMLLPIVARRPELADFGPHSTLWATIATGIGIILSYYVLPGR